MSGDDRNPSLSIDTDDGFMATEKVSHRQELANRGAGELTNPARKRFVLVDDGGEDEDLFGRTDRRCEIA